MKTLPVREHFLTFERIVNEERAKEAWRAYVEAHGWTVVGGGAHTVRKIPEGWVVVGRLIQTSETLDIRIAADANAINLP